MESPHPNRLSRINALSGLRTRLVLVAIAGIVAVAIGANLAFARSAATPVGTGVVVIETNLAYANSEAAGTGMVLTSSGEILTNNHVIRGATTIRIVVPGTGRSYTAQVIGYSISRDVAVLKASNASNLKTVSTTGSSTVSVGQQVKATGNANGTGRLVTTSGLVTAIGRSITVSDDSGTSVRLNGLIQTNAALAPGDSGGPLFNAAGKVIGMNSAATVSRGFREISASTEGYAVPIDVAMSIVDRIEKGQASATVHVGPTAFLGVSVAADSYGSGATITAVVSNGAASRAGLTTGDVITRIDGRTVSSPARLQKIILTKKPGAAISVTYLDEIGAAHSVTVTLGSGPPQ